MTANRSAQTEKLEQAIPGHLRVERTLPLAGPKELVPHHASYSARFRPEVLGITIAYYGVQSATAEIADETALAHITNAFAADDGPLFWDVASHIDSQGCRNRVVASYWRDDTANRRWEERLGEDWWYRTLDPTGSIGAFREVLRPSVSDAETTFSHRRPEGYTRVADSMSGKTDTHEYWGSARDRIPRSQTDELTPVGQPTLALGASARETMGRLFVVAPHDNLCLLRSGQDWTETEGPERDFYLAQVKPHLDAGMEELSQDGLSSGCYFNRYLRLEDGKPDERSYSLSAWHSLADLENWVKADSHLKIWAAGIKHYNRAGDAARLRLYHELVVVRAKDQSWAYFNCHSRTGMLNAVVARKSSAL